MKKKHHKIEVPALITKRIRSSQYKFVLSDFDQSHCNIIDKTEYNEYHNALKILLYCRISLHFSMMALDFSSIDPEYLTHEVIVQHLIANREKFIIGYKTINKLFILHHQILTDFFRSKLWIKISEDYHFYCPYTIIQDCWGTTSTRAKTVIPRQLWEIYLPDSRPVFITTTPQSLFSQSDDESSMQME